MHAWTHGQPIQGDRNVSFERQPSGWLDLLNPKWNAARADRAGATAKVGCLGLDRCQSGDPIKRSAMLRSG